MNAKQLNDAEKALVAGLIRELAEELGEVYSDDYYEGFTANHSEYNILATARGDVTQLLLLRQACGLHALVWSLTSGIKGRL